MNPALYAMFRSAVQYVLSFVLSHFVVLGTLLAQFGVDQTAVVEWTMSAVVFAGYVWLANWLGGRVGDDLWPRVARLAAKVMMLGLAKTPSYTGGASPSTPDGGLR